MPGRKSGGRRAADAAAPADDGLEAPAVDPSPMFDEDPGESANVEEDLEEDEEEEEPAAAQLEYESEETTASGTESLTWISWFCSLPGHEYFAEVAEDFIEDDFNLTGLNSLVPFYKEALEMVLDVEPEESLKIPDVSIVESSAELLYGLIHQRYIITRMGLQQMVAKYEQAHFGYCPRVYCNTTKIVPCGRSDLPGVDTVKLFCPSCIDTYTPPSSRFSAVDGAFFGTTFPHLLFQTYQDLLPVLTPASARGQGSASPAPTPGESSPSTSPGPSGPPARRRPSSVPRDTADDDAVAHTTPSTSAAKIYIPRIYGFKVSERARSGPRMQWLRLRPRAETELDRVDGQGRWRTNQPGGPDPASNSTATVERTRPGQADGFTGRAAVAPEDAALEEDGDAAEDQAAVGRSPRSARPPQALPSVSRS